MGVTTRILGPGRDLSSGACGFPDPTRCRGTALTGVLLAGCGAAPSRRPPTSPAPAAPRRPVVDGWPTASPRSLGFRAKRLATLRPGGQAARTAPATPWSARDAWSRDGNWGTARATPREVFSVTKSVTSALVGIAVRDGDLELGDRVSRYVRAWRGTDSAAVTVRDLLSNDSGRFWSLQSDYVTLGQAADRTTYAVGLSQQHPRDTAWAYNNAAIQVLDRVLVKATGMPTTAFAAERLFEPLGMTHTRMTQDTSGRSTNTYFGLQTTCLDLARFARLFLQRGHGRGAADPVRAASSSSRSASPSTGHNAAYGYLWWLNREGQLRGATDAVDEDGQPVRAARGPAASRAPRRRSTPRSASVARSRWSTRRSRTIVVRLGPASSDAEEPYGLPNAARVVTWALR